VTGWKRVVLAGVSMGAGAAIALFLVGGGYVWYAARPKPPKPWNTSAIRAVFDRVDTEGEKNAVAFRYTLENTTEFDFRLTRRDNLHLMAKLGEPASLMDDVAFFEVFDLPIYVPARQKVVYSIHFAYPYKEERLKADATLDERRAFRKRLANWFTKEVNLNGFVLFDDEHRYQIDFPKGW
jgi:hypothetical protein